MVFGPFKVAVWLTLVNIKNPWLVNKQKNTRDKYLPKMLIFQQANGAILGQFMDSSWY